MNTLSKARPRPSMLYGNLLVQQQVRKRLRGEPRALVGIEYLGRGSGRSGQAIHHGHGGR